MWQYTSGGQVDGIEGNVDFNLSYLRISDTREGETQEGTYLLPEGEEGSESTDETGEDSEREDGSHEEGEGSDEEEDEELESDEDTE